MVTNDGWVKIFRKARQWEWYKVDNMFHLFCHLLMGANQRDAHYQGKPVKRGQIITGFHSLSADTGISIRALRTCFERLKKSGEIEVKTTNKFSIVTICKYDDYNAKAKKNDTPNDTQDDTQNVTPPTSETTTNKNTNTINSISKEEKEKRGGNDSGGEPPAPPRSSPKSKEEKKADCDKRQLAFKDDLRQYVDTYGKEMMNTFYNYWKERNVSGSKMRWEAEKTWETKLRLLSWHKRDQKWKKPEPPDSEHPGIDPKLVKLLREEL